MHSIKKKLDLLLWVIFKMTYLWKPTDSLNFGFSKQSTFEALVSIFAPTRLAYWYNASKSSSSKSWIGIADIYQHKLKLIAQFAKFFAQCSLELYLRIFPETLAHFLFLNPALSEGLFTVRLKLLFVVMIAFLIFSYDCIYS